MPSPASAGPATQEASHGLVVVANRLPVQRTEADAEWETSPGGLVRALMGTLRQGGGAWVGWAGSIGDAPPPFEHDGVRLLPLSLDEAEYEGFYEGFSNEALWPLYHDGIRPSTFDPAWWDTYVSVNQRFAQAASRVAAPGGLVWVHDYQLQLVPAMLRELRPDVRIGYFLHIPFPPAELFSRLPWREQVLEGILGADIIGFQRQVAVENFAASASRLLDVAADLPVMKLGPRKTHVGAFPISIDVEEFDTLARMPETVEQAWKLRNRMGSPKHVLLGVDRLDYTKGIVERLRAFERLLEEGRVSPRDTVMVQLAVPTRGRLEHYAEERRQVEQLVGSINGQFGRIGYPIVHYLHQSLSLEELVPLYQAADVMVVTPLGDGMNLVAKEFAASRIDGMGVLVLSEFAGAADELTDALLVNPHDQAALADALMAALEMPTEEGAGPDGRHPGDGRGERRAAMGRELPRPAQRLRPRARLGWAFGGLSRPARVEALLDVDAAVAAAALAPSPLLVAVDVDGTLSPLAPRADQAALVPGAADVLATLVARGVPVAVVSGRGLDDLRRQFPWPDGLRLIGSHGLEDSAQHAVVPTAEERQRLQAVRTLAERAAAAVPGAWVEQKVAGVAFHYRQAKPASKGSVASQRLAERLARLEKVWVRRGHLVLEASVRPGNKAEAVAWLRSEVGAAAVVFAGDDETDEDVFRAATPSDVTVRVGPGETAARYRAADPAEVIDLLGRIATVSASPS